MGVVGFSLMATAEWLSFDKEQRKREFFERLERQEDVRERLHERLEKARASRTPLDFSDLWKTRAEATPTPSETASPAPGR